MESAERRFKALDFLLDYSKGTLWWVKDRLWKEADPRFVVKRNGHPGLSVCRRHASGLYDIVPMLIGTTKKYDPCVKVKNLDDPAEAGERTTHFAVLRPKRLRFNDFGSAKGIYPNDYKPRIDLDEMNQLDELLKWGED